MYARNTFPREGFEYFFFFEKKLYMSYAVVYPKSSFSSRRTVT